MTCRWMRVAPDPERVLYREYDIDKGNVVALTVDLSAALIDLLLKEPGIVDGVEVGPWYLPDEIAWYRKSNPELEFFFHGADLGHPVRVHPRALSRIQEYMEASGSRWVSLHLSAWLPRWMRKLLVNGWPLPPPAPALDALRLAWQARQIAGALERPVLLENVDPLPMPGYDYYAEPAYIRQVIHESGCSMLLDTGHARVTAAQFGMDMMTYTLQLPLERVKQVHLSGPREKNGRLFDAHETLQEEDYALLDFVLGRSDVQVVTLEYTREPGALREQIQRLRSMLCR